MKKTLFILLAGCTLAVNAQTFRGDWLIDCCFGGLKYSGSDSRTSFSNSPVVENNDRNSFSIRFNPGGGYFVRDNLAIGGGINFGYSNRKNETTNTTSTYTRTTESTMPSFYIGPMARYYFGGSDKCRPFTQFDFQLGMSGGKEKEETSFGAGINGETTTTSKNSWKTGLSVGYEYLFTPNVGIYGSLGFNYEKGKTTYEYRPDNNPGFDETNEYSRFYIPVNVGLQVHILGDRPRI